MLALGKIQINFLERRGEIDTDYDYDSRKCNTLILQFGFDDAEASQERTFEPCLCRQIN